MLKRKSPAALLLLAFATAPPALAEITFEVASAHTNPGSQVDIPLHFVNDGSVVGFGFDLRVLDSVFAAVDIGNCVANIEADTRGCDRLADAVRYHALDENRDPVPSGTIGTLGFSVPDQAHNGRYFLSILADSVEVATVDGSSVATPPTLRDGWIDVTGGTTILRAILGDGQQSAGYLYDNSEIPLHLVVDQLAVQSSASPDEVKLALDLPPETPGDEYGAWLLVELPAGHALADLSDIAAVREQLDAALGAGSAFVAPVFASPANPDDILFPTDDLVVAFEAAATEQDIAAVMERLEISGIELEAIHTRWYHNLYRMRRPAADGLEVLALANALAMAPETRYAEPYFGPTGKGAVPLPALFGSGFE